jgi:outer membrane protein TolC
MNKRGMKLTAIAASIVVLAGCASVTPQGVLENVSARVGAQVPAQLTLASNEAELKKAQSRVETLLSQELSQAGAVELAMNNSPAFQAMLARGIANTANAAQSGRISNPNFAFERMTTTGELELARMLSFGLLDLLTLPKRQAIAKVAVDQAQLDLAQQVVKDISSVKLAWVGAIAAEQRLAYAQQVQRSANASAELAKRLLAVGNFSWLQQTKQQQFASDAAIALASAQHARTSAYEELVRVLGLTTQQQAELQLPKRLPAIPKNILLPAQINTAAGDIRLDIGLAKLNLQQFLDSSSLETLNSFTDVELGVKGVDKKDTASGEVTSSNGFEIAIKLPIFDWGDNKRVALSANQIAAQRTWEATVINANSQLRVSYSAYRTAHDLAMHYQDVVLPMRARISEENQYRYNGMLISVFDLLSDARGQIDTVTQALNATEQFWITDAILQNNLMGVPSQAAAMATAAPANDAAGGH